MSKSCVICGGEESEGELLVDAPCGRHSVCPEDVASFFERATSNESLFPPKCCGQMFLLEDYEDYIPFEISWPYQIKEQGEYAILAKYRVYCANQPCAKFLHPTSHVEDPDTKTTYAICENEDCGKLTCCSCKTLLHHGTQNHVCHQDEDEKKFKEIATKKGYQECFVCGATVELAEACNHITCECGHQFCYICGKDWPGFHGCPHYGPAIYDAEGYNQDGFHRDTALNRDGLTRRQAIARARGEGDPNEDDNDDEEEEEDPEWEVLQHIDAAQRVVINQLPQDEREDALDNLRIMLHDTQGIIFGQGQGQNDENNGENDDENDNSDDDEPVNLANENSDGEDDNAEDEENHEPQDDNDIFDNEEEGLQNDQIVHNQPNDALIARALRALIDPLFDEEAPDNDQIVHDQPNEGLSPGVPPALFDSPFGDDDSEAHQAGTPEGRASLSSASEDVRPPTPMDIDEPPLVEEAKERERLDRDHVPPHGWYEFDEQL